MSILPLGNNRVVRTVLLVVIGLFLCSFFVRQCRGAQMDFVTGSALVRGPAGAFGLNVCEPRAIAGFADVCAGFMLIGDSSWRGHNDYQAVAHAQVVSHLWLGFELGIGLAHLQHADAYNSGAVDFSLSLQHRVYKNLYLRYQHFSNAGTSMPNQGRDIVLATWRF